MFKSLTDLHILHPFPIFGIFADDDGASGTQSTAHRSIESVKAEGLATELLLALPGLCRVGVGSNLVWERQTRWKEDCASELHVQLLPRTEIPSFYEVESPLSLVRGEKDDGEPAIGDVLGLLQCL